MFGDLLSSPGHLSSTVTASAFFSNSGSNSFAHAPFLPATTTRPLPRREDKGDWRAARRGATRDARLGATSATWAALQAMSAVSVLQGKSGEPRI